MSEMKDFKGMTMREILIEFGKGCSVSSGGNPAVCADCTDAAIQAISQLETSKQKSARDAALVEAADTLEAQALDADAQAKRFRGGSDPWADRTARSRALRNSAAAILALRDKPAPAVTVREWQPIETAPKDGTWVILYGPDEGDPSIEFWLARWCRDEWRWFDQDDDVVVRDGAMTHWMPLPEPPQSKFTPLGVNAGGKAIAANDQQLAAIRTAQGPKE